MRSKLNWRRNAVLRGLGSLWLSGVLIVVILVAMACATVFESSHGTEQALAMFYRSRWFEVLLGFLAVSAGIAVILRFPISKKKIGFVVTHASIFVVLAGALVTDRLGVDGQVGILEGNTVEQLDIIRDTLTLMKRSDETEATADLGALPSGGLWAVERPAVPALELDDVSIEVAQYLPDSEESQEVVNDGSAARLAVEVSFADPHGRGEESAWVFAQQTVPLHSTSVQFRKVDEAELRRFTEEAPETPREQATSVGSVRVEYEGATFEFPVEQCTQDAVAVGETGFSLKVVRYLPHAVVGKGNRLENASDRPVNPTIEVELTGPEGTVRRPVFANFPDFWKMHGDEIEKIIEGLNVTFVASSVAEQFAPICVLSGPDGKLYARFAPQGQPAVTKELTIGEPCESPWAGRRFTVLRQFDRARIKRTMTAVEPVRKNRVAAVLLKVKSPSGTESVWLQKYRSEMVRGKDATYDVIYANKRVPLGFSVTLEDFHIGYFPGTRRPRSFESQISILDPASGRRLNRVVSMNNPTKFGGYTFYQSSYRQQGEQMASILSVSRDWGQPIVFAGYIGMLAGMLLILVQRVAAHRGRAPAVPEAGSAKGGRPKPKSSNR